MRDRFLIFNTDNDPIIHGLTYYLTRANNGEDFTQEELHEANNLVKDLLNYGFEHGFHENIWQMYLTHFLMWDENPFSLGCERNTEGPDERIKEIALWDLAHFRDYFALDFSALSFHLGRDLTILEKTSRGKQSKRLSEASVENISALCAKLKKCEDAEEFMKCLMKDYAWHGVGELGLHKAFRIDDSGNIYSINRIANVHFDDLVGLSDQKAELRKNTEAFVTGLPANNCLLYGDAGTGKSSSIKAIANEFYDRGLRIVEVYKHQFRALNDVIGVLKNRNYRFIIYMDDLSFEEFEVEYKYLKALIEGGLEKKPDNILIYATSNKRHLVRESFEARNDDIHKNDTMQEKLSLFARFGVTIYFGAPDKKEFNAIVLSLKSRYGIEMSDEEILKRANSWEVYHGGRSGRSATQFIDYLRGEQ